MVSSDEEGMTVFMMCLLTLVSAAFVRCSAIISALLLEIFSSYTKKIAIIVPDAHASLYGNHSTMLSLSYPFFLT